LYRKSIYKIQNNLAKHKINKYNDFLIRGIEKSSLAFGSVTLFFVI